MRDHNGQQLAYVYFEDELGRQIGEPLRNGLNEQSIGLNYQATAAPFGILRREFYDADAEGMPKENNGPTFEGCEPSMLFREFAAECMELAQTTPSPEKHSLYLKMACVWFQMALRWEKKG